MNLLFYYIWKFFPEVYRIVCYFPAVQFVVFIMASLFNNLHMQIAPNPLWIINTDWYFCFILNKVLIVIILGVKCHHASSGW